VTYYFNGFTCPLSPTLSLKGARELSFALCLHRARGEGCNDVKRLFTYSPVHLLTFLLISLAGERGFLLLELRIFGINIY